MLFELVLSLSCEKTKQELLKLEKFREFFLSR